MLYLVREPDFLTIAASGKLTREDYAAVVPRIEEELAQRGPLRLLIRLGDFEGWTRGGLLEELRFDLRHRKDLARVAIVGERTIERVGALVSRPLFSADMRYYGPGEEDRARAWLREPLTNGRTTRSAKLLAASFLLAGTSKLFGAAPMRESFAAWGYSQRFRVFVGIAEVAGAIGLLLPATRRPAALGLSALMGGAIATHIANREVKNALPAVGMLVSAAKLAAPSVGAAHAASRP